MATFSFRKKYITRLHLEDGSYIIDHDQKAQALWFSFKDRLGQSEFTELSYNLAELLQWVDLPDLDTDFSMEEIQAALSDMPSDHAPGPDGFNGAFFKEMLGDY